MATRFRHLTNSELVVIAKPTNDLEAELIARLEVACRVDHRIGSLVGNNSTLPVESEGGHHD